MGVTIEGFGREFKYGFLGEREGDYIRRVQSYIEYLPEDQKSLVLDLLNLQWVSFIQQLWFVGDVTGKPDHGKIHFTLARMEINSEIRRENNLPERNMRNALYRLSYKDVLHILESAPDIPAPEKVARI